MVWLLFPGSSVELPLAAPITRQHQHALGSDPVGQLNIHVAVSHDKRLGEVNPVSSGSRFQQPRRRFPTSTLYPVFFQNALRMMRAVENVVQLPPGGGDFAPKLLVDFFYKRLRK